MEKTTSSLLFWRTSWRSWISMNGIHHWLQARVQKIGNDQDFNNDKFNFASERWICWSILLVSWITWRYFEVKMANRYFQKLFCGFFLVQLKIWMVNTRIYATFLWERIQWSSCIKVLNRSWLGIQKFSVSSSFSPILKSHEKYDRFLLMQFASWHTNTLTRK